MANELAVSVALVFSKSGRSLKIQKSGVQSDVAGDQYIEHIQNIGTSEEAITLGDVAAGGYMFLENLDATNYIEIRPATGVADLIRLDPGDVALFRLTDDASAPFAIANSSACDMRVVLVDA